MFTGNPGHLKTFDYAGFHRYFLTFCTDKRHRVFTTPTVVDLVLAQILRAADDEQFAIVAYCFMPDHLHLLIEAKSESANCIRFITRAKQFSGFYYSKSFGKRLWQRYGFEHTLRNDEDTLVVARYVLANPVRAELVINPEDYPYSGSKTHSVADILAAVGEYSRSG